MTDSRKNDKVLIKNCISGDPEAKNSFIDQFSGLLYKYIRTTLELYCKDYLNEDLEDLHNDIFLSLLKDDCRKLKMYRGDNGCSVASWLRIIAVNTTINFATRSKTTVSLDDQLTDRQSIAEKTPSPAKNADEILLKREEAELFNRALQKLSPDDRLVIKYRYMKDQSPEEIAVLMHTTPNAVYSKLSRARKKLASMVQELKGD
ncbi:MAG: sigma-70 family RNA polymerase sigma factor [Nitrospira sp.]|nr:sigma-70 family RNA polymerase sigma factor [bacterium]MBL7048991.1 sigma-70 family RNA polymerase sigma factor [Nitrospira sp.]